MQLDRVQINNFRNLEGVSLTPSSSINFFFGDNGSGKTSLLEALYYLAYGRSFRTSKYQSLISHDDTHFTLFAKVDDGREEMRVGLSRNRHGNVEVKVNGESLSRLSDLATRMPTQIFTPQSSDSLTGSPSLRRSFMDWGVFHVKHQFPKIAGQYAKLLKQRNALLKQKNIDGDFDKFWIEKLAWAGEAISECRAGYVEALRPYFESKIKYFLPEFLCKLEYYRGWDKTTPLHDAIEGSRQRDQLLGSTQLGPHKADLRIKVEGKSVQEILSRGQLRVLMAALQLAQTTYLYEAHNTNSIYLLDDIGAELDADKRQKFIQQLLGTEAQIFITATDYSQFGDLTQLENIKMFHVEHGRVNEEKVNNG